MMIMFFVSCKARKIDPPPPAAIKKPAEIIFNANFSDGSPPCSWNYFDKQWVYIEVWSYDFDQNKHIKDGSTIKKTENDFDQNGKIVINLPTEGTYYLDITIVKDCDECCGISSTNPENCPSDFRGKPEWKYKTHPTIYMETVSVPVDFNQCRCECE